MNINNSMIKEIITSFLTANNGEVNYVEKFDEIIFPMKCYLYAILVLLIVITTTNFLILLKN